MPCVFELQVVVVLCHGLYRIALPLNPVIVYLEAGLARLTLRIGQIQLLLDLRVPLRKALGNLELRFPALVQIVGVIYSFEQNIRLRAVRTLLFLTLQPVRAIAHNLGQLLAERILSITPWLRNVGSSPNFSHCWFGRLSLQQNQGRNVFPRQATTRMKQWIFPGDE